MAINLTRFPAPLRPPLLSSVVSYVMGGTSRYGMSTGFMMVSALVRSSIEWRLIS